MNAALHSALFWGIMGELTLLTVTTLALILLPDAPRLDEDPEESP